MPDTTLTIGAGERAALYAQATQNLSGIADVFPHYERGELDTARQLANRAAQDTRGYRAFGLERRRSPA